MAKGTIKKLVADRGFGFIVGEDGKEIFFHISGVVGETEFDQMREGQTVEYKLGKSDKGPRAENVQAT